MYPEGHHAAYYDQFAPGTDAYKARQRAADEARQAAGGDAQVFVGNMPTRVTAEDLAAAFGPYGTITAVRLIDTARGGQKLVGGRALGFVTFSHADEARAAIDALNGLVARASPITDADDAVALKVQIQRGARPAAQPTQEPASWRRRRGADPEEKKKKMSRNLTGIL